MQSFDRLIEAGAPGQAPGSPEQFSGPSSLGGSGGGRVIPPKLYRIGEVVDYAGLSRQTIHNYTTMGLLRESQWTRGGHRLYDESVFGRLDQIARLKQSLKTMQEIRQHFALLDATTT